MDHESMASALAVGRDLHAAVHAWAVRRVERVAVRGADAGPSASPATTPAQPTPVPGTALAALVRLRVAGRGPMTGYSQAAFGPAWTDTNRNGCDTRNDILGRDLVAKTYKAGTGGCLVLSGTLHDPYTATVIRFVRGGTSEVDIDHLVALGNAWVYRCAYVARQVSVKAKYGLYVTPAERDAMARVLGSCPRQPLLTGGNPILSTVTPGATSPRPSTSPRSSSPGRGSVYYANCTEARAAGAAPIYAGQPGYRLALDRDGIACESQRNAPSAQAEGAAHSTAQRCTRMRRLSAFLTVRSAGADLAYLCR